MLVTGVTGMLGNNVARLLLEQGATVRALVRANSDARPVAGLQIKTVQGDVCNGDCLRNGCRDVQLVIHCAGRVHIGCSGLDESRQVNVEGTRKVAQAALAVGARMVHVSTMNTLGIGQGSGFGSTVMPERAVAKKPPVAICTPRSSHRICLQLQCAARERVDQETIAGRWQSLKAGMRSCSLTCSDHAWEFLAL